MRDFKFPELVFRSARSPGIQVAGKRKKPSSPRNHLVAFTAPDEFYRTASRAALHGY